MQAWACSHSGLRWACLMPSQPARAPKSKLRFKSVSIANPPQSLVLLHSRTARLPRCSPSSLIEIPAGGHTARLPMLISVAPAQLGSSWQQQQRWKPGPRPSTLPRTRCAVRHRTCPSQQAVSHDACGSASQKKTRTSVAGFLRLRMR